MLLTGHYYTVAASLEFSRVELDVLIEAGANHYDAKCRRVAHEGFLIGWLAQMEHIEEWKLVFPIEVPTHRIDTLMKMLEMRRTTFAHEPHKLQVAARLAMGLRSAFLSCQAEHKRLNPPEESDEPTDTASAA